MEVFCVKRFAFGKALRNRRYYISIDLRYSTDQRRSTIEIDTANVDRNKRRKT